MTREEAIKYLTNDWFKMRNGQVCVEYDHSDRFLEAIGMAISALREQPQWISVEERLPDLELVEVRTNDTELYPCLAVIKNECARNEKYVGKVWYDGYGFMNVIGEREVITHWMPLPEPPEEG